jgi:mannose-1-phosphate guanylyltransferase
MKAIILAGGVGTRLWPLSRQTQPKQFRDVISERPLIRDTYARLRQRFAEEDIYFSISPYFDELIHETFPDVPDERILIEPDKRDTGPAMGYVAALLELKDPDEPIVFVPADHYIRDEGVFLDCLQTGGELIEETGKLVDIAIQPTFPSTVLGYTKVGDKQFDRNGIEVYDFAGHTEKPAYPVAKSYLDDGSYLWHANYYMWTPRKFMEAFEEFAPEMGRIFRDIQEAVQDDRTEDVLDLYKQLPKTSIDYAVTENMEGGNVLIIKGEFGWSDIGAWDTLYDRLSSDKGLENVTKGKTVTVDTTRSIIYGSDDKLIAVLGMDDVVVVDNENSLLVCKKGDAQRVKDLVKKLREEGNKDHL